MIKAQARGRVSNSAAGSPPEAPNSAAGQLGKIAANPLISGRFSTLRGGVLEAERGLSLLAGTRGLQILVVAGLGLISAGPAPAQQQASPQPVLRLETGMHTAPIRAAASDAAGQVLATVSDDKTLRLWVLASGEPIRVLRPQIGAGAEGELKAVALSPDAQYVVTGGWTGFAWEKANSLYV